jgi:hypothetical protein
VHRPSAEKLRPVFAPWSGVERCLCAEGLEIRSQIELENPLYRGADEVLMERVFYLPIRPSTEATSSAPVS